MQHRRVRMLLVASAVLVLPSCQEPTAPAHSLSAAKGSLGPKTYEVVALATPAGGSSAATSINDSGHVVGWLKETSSSPRVPVMWRGAAAQLLGTRPGFSGNTTPRAINLAGRVLMEEIGLAPVSYILDKGTRVILETSGLGCEAKAYGMNDHGNAAGIVWVDPRGSCPDFNDPSAKWRAARWTSTGALSVLPVSANDGRDAHAWDINLKNQVVGFELLAGIPAVGVIWDEGGRQTAVSNVASGRLAINNAGQVVACGEGNAPFTWKRGKLEWLGEADGFCPTDVNSNGVVVGHGRAASADPVLAVVWIGGRMTLLPSLGGSSHAWAVNAKGQIVGDITTSSGTFAVLWQPN